jgi:hypothetical protein
VWPKLTVVEPTRVLLEGLSPANAYDLTPHHGSPPARLRDDGPPLRRLVIGTRVGLQVIAFDEVARIEGVDSVFFTVVEDGARPSGRVEIEVREVPRRRPRR